MKYLLIESHSEGSWEPWYNTVVDISNSKEELEEKAARYNLRRDLEDRFEDQARKFFEDHENDRTAPEIPEEYQPFMSIVDSEDEEGPYQYLSWDDYRGVLVYKVEEIKKAQYGD